MLILIILIIIILSLNLFDFLSMFILLSLRSNNFLNLIASHGKCWFILLSLRSYNFLNLIASHGKSRLSLTYSLASPLRSKYPSFVGCFRIHRDWFNWNRWSSMSDFKNSCFFLKSRLFKYKFYLYQLS